MSSSSSGAILDGLDDVEDYIWAYQGNMPSNQYSYVFDLIEKGNKSFREGRFEEAIGCYTRGHNIKPDDPVILSNRCAAYMRQSQFLIHRPSSASECRPLMGLDPTTHAELALKDAEKVLNLQSTMVKAYVLKANALILLERYDMAKDVIISGLQLDPQSTTLQTYVQNLRPLVNIAGRRSHVRPERTDDFDCTLCLKLLYEPVTTPCGHTFCRACLLQSMDRGNKCPLCRTILFTSARTCAVSVTLSNIIQKNFSEEYAERKAEHDSLTNLGVDLIPLFVMDVALPCQKISLNIFEPRYRLMIRRIMEGNHRMGMAIKLDPTTVADFACEVEITECEPLPDGRIFIEVEGRRRFRILRSWDQDGYRVGQVEWVQDIYPPEGTRERLDLQESTNNAAEFARYWMRRAKEAARQDRRRLEYLLRIERMMPSPQDPERFSFWLATLLDRRPLEKLDLLTLRDTRERINRGLVFLGADQEGCTIQ